VEIGDPSQAMLHISKTMASLANAEGNFGILNLKANLLLCEIQSSLESYVYDAFRLINCKSLTLKV
jgi:hypothetical protein